MGKTTAIEWCDSTLNLMMGCDGCELAAKGGSGTCYAETLTNRHAGHSSGYPASFYKPKLFLDRMKEAERWPDLTGVERPEKPHLSGLPRHIFHGDMGDYWTESLPLDWLAPHVHLIGAIPGVHIFLTKRPERMFRFWDEAFDGEVPPNFTLLTSITSAANLKRYEWIVRLGIRTGARVGLSVEPLVGPVSFEKREGGLGRLAWVIVGGESGAGARPFQLSWARKILAQCRTAGIPFFLKQVGSNPHSDGRYTRDGLRQLRDRKGGDPGEWPPDLRVREMPEVAHG